MKLEICVEDQAGAIDAAAGGADRLELCAALAIGGVTPSASLVRYAASLAIPARLLARPSDGGFVYSKLEVDQVAEDMTAAAEAGLEGVVIGASTSDRSLDTKALSSWVAHAKLLGAARGQPLALTLHRAFDLCPDLELALETAIELGFDTVLTSGGAPLAVDAQDMLRKLVGRAAGRIEILAGSGIGAANVGQILAAGITQVHASCRVAVSVDDALEQKFGFSTGVRRTLHKQAVRDLRLEMDRFGLGKNNTLNNTNI